MVNYQDTKIYYINVGDDLYYGHTARRYLSTRQAHHRNRFRNPNSKQKIYEKMRELHMTADDIVCVWVEDYPCDSVEEAKARERYWVEHFGTLNSQIPNRTVDEWYEANKEHHAQRMKEYREANKEHLAQYQKEWREVNKEHRAQKGKEWREVNKEIIAQKKKEYREANKEKVAEQKRAYYQRKKELKN